MAARLAKKAVVEIDGLCGRTTCIPDPVEGEHLNGASYLLPCLLAQSPLDLVIIKLGCNDQKARFNMSGLDIAQGVARLVKIVKNSGANNGKAPEILVIQPAPIKLRSFAETFKGAPEQAQNMSEAFKQEMAALKVPFLSEGDFVESSDIDGIHLDIEAHAIIGEKIADRVESIFSHNRK